MPWRRTEPYEHLPIRVVGEFHRERDVLTYCSQCGRPWEQGQDDCPGCGYAPAQSLAASGDGASGIGASGIGPSGIEATLQEGGVGSVTHKKEGVTWGGWQILAGIVLVILSLLTAAMAASFIGSLYPEQETSVATWISVHLMALGIGATVWFLGLRHTRYPLMVLGLSGVRLPRKRTVWLMVVVLATSLVASTLYSNIVDWLDVEALSPPDDRPDILFDGWAVLLTFQALAFITPLSEEIFFRGFIFGGLRPKLGPWWAIVASALVFSAFHFSLGVLIPIFITGFLLGWLYWRTGSLWAAIGAHAGQNAIALSAYALVG